MQEHRPTRTLVSPVPPHARRGSAEVAVAPAPEGVVASSGPRSVRASDDRFQQVQASLSRLQELETAPPSLKSQRFDVPAAGEPATRRSGYPGAEEAGLDASGVVRGVHLEPRFDLAEAVEHAALRELPADVLRSSVRRLGQYALLNTAALACVASVGAIVAATSAAPWLASYLRYLPPLIAAVLLNLGLFALTRSARIAARVVVLFGSLHLVLYCLALGVFRHSQPWLAAEALRSFAPAALAIVLFGALIPLRPARVLTWGLLATATDPLTATLTGANAGSASSLLLLSLSPLIGSALAYFCSTLTYDLTERVTRARAVGAYRLLERLGGGGMGEVWRAEHKMLARGAAIKLIRPKALSVDEPAEAQRVVRLFELEAQATTLLTSPHTINVFDFGVTSEGHFYYAMELLDGFDLQQLVEQHGPLDAARVAHILVQVADSLSEAHSHQYVHRDLKPANVFLCRYGGKVDFVKVLDFGLVLDASEDSSDERPGQIGTPSIMAPEMLVAGARVDHRSDLYALGCLGYWLLTGTRVFPAKTRAEMLRMHASVVPEPPSLRGKREVPPVLEQIVMKCLQKNPAARPQSALEIADALEASGLVKSWPREAAQTFWEQHARGPLSARLSSVA
jgi:eukaryotic-like serine/threonine-protein kinase